MASEAGAGAGVEAADWKEGRGPALEHLGHEGVNDHVCRNVVPSRAGGINRLHPCPPGLNSGPLLSLGSGRSGMNGGVGNSRGVGCGVSPALPLQGASHERRQPSPHIRSLRAPAGWAEGLTVPHPWKPSWDPSPYLV